MKDGLRVDVVAQSGERLIKGEDLIEGGKVPPHMLHDILHKHSIIYSAEKGRSPRLGLHVSFQPDHQSRDDFILILDLQRSILKQQA